MRLPNLSVTGSLLLALSSIAGSTVIPSDIRLREASPLKPLGSTIKSARSPQNSCSTPDASCLQSLRDAAPLIVVREPTPVNPPSSAAKSARSPKNSCSTPDPSCLQSLRDAAPLVPLPEPVAVQVRTSPVNAARSPRNSCATPDPACLQSLRDAAPLATLPEAEPVQVRSTNIKSARDPRNSCSTTNAGCLQSLRDVSPIVPLVKTEPIEVRSSVVNSARAPQNSCSTPDASCLQSLRDAAPMLSPREPDPISPPLDASSVESARSTIKSARSPQNSCSTPDPSCLQSLRDAAPEIEERDVYIVAPIAEYSAAASNNKYVHQGVEVTSEHVFMYLERLGNIQWEVESPNGRHADISDAMWLTGLDGAVRRKRSFAPIPDPHTISSVSDMSVVRGHQTSASCYVQDANVSAEHLQLAITSACHAFAQDVMLMPSVLRLYETRIQDGATLRVAVRALVGQSMIDEAMCQASLTRVSSLCTNSGMGSSGGEAIVGGKFLFTVDPMESYL